MATFFSADHHFSHRNIIEFCGRPFRTLDGQPDVEQMNEEMVRRWNAVVSPDDDVFYLGDFVFGSLANVTATLERLNGSKHLVLGNHDRHTKAAYRRAGFREVSKSLNLTIDRVRVLLKHHPEPCPDQYDIVLCGHVHEAWARRGDCINVGVDVWQFRPISLREALATAVKEDK